jgi:effector-binding domain-containing protein
MQINIILIYIVDFIVILLEEYVDYAAFIFENGRKKSKENALKSFTGYNRFSHYRKKIIYLAINRYTTISNDRERFSKEYLQQRNRERYAKPISIQSRYNYIANNCI